MSIQDHGSPADPEPMTSGLDTEDGLVPANCRRRDTHQAVWRGLRGSRRCVACAILDDLSMREAGVAEQDLTMQGGTLTRAALQLLFAEGVIRAVPTGFLFSATEPVVVDRTAKRAAVAERARLAAIEEQRAQLRRRQPVPVELQPNYAPPKAPRPEPVAEPRPAWELPAEPGDARGATEPVAEQPVSPPAAVSPPATSEGLWTAERRALWSQMSMERRAAQRARKVAEQREAEELQRRARESAAIRRSAGDDPGPSPALDQTDRLDG